MSIRWRVQLKLDSFELQGVERNIIADSSHAFLVNMGALYCTPLTAVPASFLCKTSIGSSNMFTVLLSHCREHCRLGVCSHFGWVWQILWKPNQLTVRRASLSEGTLLTCLSPLRSPLLFAVRLPTAQWIVPNFHFSRLLLFHILLLLLTFNFLLFIVCPINCTKLPFHTAGRQSSCANWHISFRQGVCKINWIKFDLNKALS